MKKIAVLAITKNGIEIGLKLKEYFSDFEIFAPTKFSNDNEKIQWYENSTTQKIVDLFKNNDGIICLFSLGAVIRLLAPHIKDKKTDPAVIVIDDNANFVISVLSGHLGGANELSNEIAEKMGSTPIITTAADVNKTIAVDLVGREFGWKINDDSNVTRISAFMVNKEKIGVFQNIGKKEWWKGKLPENITFFSDMKELKDSDSKAYLIITNDEINDEEVEKAVISLLKHIPGNTILIDHFLDRCQEAEVDAIFDGENFHIMGVMEHIEPAGIHSGDSNAVLPAFNLTPLVVETMEYYSEKIARALNIKGLINIQFAIKDGKVYVIEANPRASRTTPFIAKAYQIPYLNIATKVMLGANKLTDFTMDKKLEGYAIKEPVFSFEKFPGVNKELGPEMKSTGEAIRFIKDLRDPYFRTLYKERSMNLSK